MVDQNTSRPASLTTCLFTGKALTADTKREHTIQQAVGGRIKSRCVSCNEFNRMAGDSCDRSFAASYAPVFNRVGLLTHSSHKIPQYAAEIPGEPGKFVFRPGGILVRQRPYIAERDDEGRPKTVYGADRGELRRLIETSNPDPTAFKLSVVPAVPKTEASFDTGLFNLSTEIAALKAILLTFDHQLSGSHLQFTRSPQLIAVRELVRLFVIDRKLDQHCYDKTVLGLQYDKMSELQRLRQLAHAPMTPFEHIMIACGNVATRTLDAVWWVSGIDPYGFRLSTNWTERPFTYLLVSGVMKATHTDLSQLRQEFNCRPQPRWRAKEEPGTTELESGHGTGTQLVKQERDIADAIRFRESNGKPTVTNQAETACRRAM
jgi:hypothetical protein